jgi:hypothetical protein
VRSSRTQRGSTTVGQFTVIIPTLQRSSLLGELVSRLGDSPLVDEVLVVNNAEAPWTSPHPKCRVLDVGHNIFVNPAWNLGAREARAPLLAIVNDDVLFDAGILRPIARRLGRGAGIIGPAAGCVRDVEAPRSRILRRPFFVPAYERPYAFGTAMFMRREDYVPIPDDLKVWRGDDYLFRRQVRRNFVMLGIDVRTHMSTTSGDPAFDAIKEADMTAFHQHHAEDAYRLRFWKEFRIARSIGSAWARGAQLVARPEARRG